MPSVKPKTNKKKVSKRKPYKEGKLRTPQVRILKALLASGDHGLTRPEIAKKAKVSLSMTGNLGPVDPDTVPDVNKRYGKQCLTGLKYVRSQMEEAKDGSDIVRYYITVLGKTALRKSETK